MSRGDIKVNPPIPFPREPVTKNIPPELVQFHRDLRNYIARIVDFLGDPFKNRGGSGAVLASGKGVVTVGSVATTVACPFVTDDTPILITEYDILPLGDDPPSHLFVGTIVPGVSFDVIATDALDNNGFYWAVLAA